MTNLEELEDLFEDLNVEYPCKEHLDKFFDIYEKDLVDDYIEIDGVRLIFKNHKSLVKGFEGYPETFVHLITKEESYNKPRKFDYRRANKIHWIKPILLNRNNPKILCFEKIDSKKVLKKYFWFKDKKFVVILKPMSPKILLVTAFCVEKTKEMDFDYEYQKYKKI